MNGHSQALAIFEMIGRQCRRVYPSRQGRLRFFKGLNCGVGPVKNQDWRIHQEPIMHGGQKQPTVHSKKVGKSSARDGRERERERETDRQTDRQTETERELGIWTLAPGSEESSWRLKKRLGLTASENRQSAGPLLTMGTNLMISTGGGSFSFLGGRQTPA